MARINSFCSHEFQSVGTQNIPKYGASPVTRPSAHDKKNWSITIHMYIYTVYKYIYIYPTFGHFWPQAPFLVGNIIHKTVASAPCLMGFCCLIILISQSTHTSGHPSGCGITGVDIKHLRRTLHQRSTWLIRSWHRWGCMQCVDTWMCIPVSKWIILYIYFTHINILILGRLLWSLADNHDCEPVAIWPHPNTLVEPTEIEKSCWTWANSPC